MPFGHDSGNSYAAQGEREYQNRSKCSCGADSWDDILWCSEEDKICYALNQRDCKFYEYSGQCEFAVNKMQCRDCGEIVGGD